MAKKEKVVVERIKKGKTPAQKAKTAENMRAAAERLARLQAKQKLANSLRAKHGYIGTNPDEIIAQHDRTLERVARELYKAEKQAEREAANKAEKDASDYVGMVLSLPKTGRIVANWLNNRIDFPAIEVKVLIEKFLAKENNEYHKVAVEHHLAKASAAAA